VINARALKYRIYRFQDHDTVGSYECDEIHVVHHLSIDTLILLQSARPKIDRSQRANARQDVR